MKLNMLVVLMYHKSVVDEGQSLSALWIEMELFSLPVVLSLTQKAPLLMNYLCLSLLRSITWFQLWLTWPTRVFSDDFILDIR